MEPQVEKLDVTKLVQQEGFDCSECNHRHAGKSLAYICVGCPCHVRDPDKMNCSHEHVELYVTAGRFAPPASYWSCANCGKPFEPTK